MRAPLLIGCVAVVTLVGLILGPGARSGDPHFGSTTGTVVTKVLSTPTGQRFTLSGTARHITASAPRSNTDGNVRQVLWKSGATVAADQEVCAVWQDTATSAGSPGRNRQPGLALRIAPATSDGRGVRAVTLTQNIYGYSSWQFWVDLWSSVDPARPQAHGVEVFDLRDLILEPDGSQVPPPWHVCARVVGDRFSFEIWFDDEPDPHWRDPSRVFTTRLPAGWDRPGVAGVYIGHLHAGQSARFTGLTTRTLATTRREQTPSARLPGKARPATPALGWPTYVG